MPKPLSVLSFPDFLFPPLRQNLILTSKKGEKTGEKEAKNRDFRTRKV